MKCDHATIKETDDCSSRCLPPFTTGWLMTMESPSVGEQNIDWDQRFTPRLLSMEAFADMTNIAHNWVWSVGRVWTEEEEREEMSVCWFEPKFLPPNRWRGKNWRCLPGRKRGETTEGMMRCRVVPFHLLAEEQLWCVKLLEWGERDGCHWSVTASRNATSLMVRSEVKDAQLVTATTLWDYVFQVKDLSTKLRDHFPSKSTS